MAQRPQPTEMDDCSRRQFLGRTATAGGAVAAIGAGGHKIAPQHSPIGRAQALAPVAPIGAGAAAGALGYLITEGVDRILGDDRDYSGYTGSEALHQNIMTGAAEMNSADERVMTSIENNITHSRAVGLAKGKAAIIEEMNAEENEDAATDAMYDAIDDYYATIEENIINHYTAQYDQLLHMAEMVQTHGSISLSTVFEGYIDSNYHDANTDGGGSAGVHKFLTREDNDDVVDYELANGETIEVKISIGELALDTFESVAPHTSLVPNGLTRFRIRPVDDEDPVGFFDCQRYHDALESASAERDTVVSDLTGFVSDVYNFYSPGDIPTEDLVDPITASTELRQDYDNRAGQGAHAAMLGIPTNADFSALLHIYSDDLPDGADEDYWDVWADIFTNHVPTDEEGDEVGFEVGETYDPSEWDAPLFIAYEYIDSVTGDERADFTQIESEFSIELVEDADGNEVENFQTESRNSQTSDIESLEDELEALREEQIRLQEEAQDQNGGGGGGIGDWFGGGSQGGVLVGGLIVLAAIVGIGQVTG
ncbi:twin-arginine translocation signal domain-containing protein [Natrarchaeobius halalkaliphilus]|uniref:Twin-arginine translocation signal domain-containing protein n=1 Tax=Natrarchaeobius halalkaliphilus TaxID=1679091 RepID=A0A3N6NUW6_9EURY|nr:twin-arginine translocation signal domain-containing protein [Natrarchaeobius halalkaliphilus]RQG87030.1 twin-arginine translocation signal domain-containing protein [Natrarchaeobius halalkaliphilus]